MHRALQVLARHPDYPKIKDDILHVGMHKVRAASEKEQLRTLGLLQAAA